tara:strand:+ start:276 stop:914 length:639 start_codon:yes stop_codon:yes gene_type:complete
MAEFEYKIKNIFSPIFEKINNPMILEFGVQEGRSTHEFLKWCQLKNGKLFSFDIEDCSNVSNNDAWKFYKSRDDNFKFIFSKIPEELDVIFLDTLHEADHVEKIFYNYFSFLKVGGYFIIDDISHLPYLKGSDRNNFYCEINNQETFKRILEIYEPNKEIFDLNFSFISSGLAIIKKKLNNKLNKKKIIKTRENSIKNKLRKLKHIINEKKY